jgi:hypothetical protein
VETVPACRETPDFLYCVAQAMSDTRPIPPEVPRDRAPRDYAEQRALLEDSLRNIPPPGAGVLPDAPASVELLGVKVDLTLSDGAEPLVLIHTRGNPDGTATIAVSASQIAKDELAALFGVLATTIKESMTE